MFKNLPREVALLPREVGRILSFLNLIIFFMFKTLPREVALLPREVG